MKEKMKIFLKKFKNILPLLLACLLVGAMVLGLYLFSQSEQVKTLSASAEEATTVADVESGIDLTQYPSANLIDISKCLNSNFTVDEDGVYTMKRNEGGARFSSFYVFPTSLPAGTYTFSCEFVEYTGSYLYWLQAEVCTNNGTLYFHIDLSCGTPNEVISLTFKNPVTSIRFYMSSGDPVGTVSKFKNFMMNAGDTAYPYIPNLDNAYNNGYNAGYFTGYELGLEDAYAFDIGYDKGYDKGYKEGLAKGQTDDPYNLGDFIFSIIDAPFRVIREALNFEFLGYDVSEIVFFILTGAIFIFVLKKLKGG